MVIATTTSLSGQLMINTTNIHIYGIRIRKNFWLGMQRNPFLKSEFVILSTNSETNGSAFFVFSLLWSMDVSRMGILLQLPLSWFQTNSLQKEGILFCLWNWSGMLTHILIVPKSFVIAWRMLLLDQQEWMVQNTP